MGIGWRVVLGTAVVLGSLGGPTGGITRARAQATVPPEVVFQSEVLERTSGQPSDHRMTFDTCDPSGSYRMVIENGVDGSVRVSSGRVLLNGTPIVTESDLNQQVGGLVRAVVLGASNTLDVHLTGGPGGRLRFTVDGYRRCLKVRITAPLPGALVPAPAALIEGDLESTGAAGVQLRVALPIRGHLVEAMMPAEVSARRWAAWVPLAPGEAEITALASDDVGRTAQDSVRLSVQPDPPDDDRPGRLEASPTAGFSPLPVTFAGGHATDPEIDLLDLDIDGDGVPDYGLSDFSAPPHQVTHTYVGEGLYLATMRVRHAPTGRVRSVSAPINVIPAPDLARLWDAFLAALGRGDGDAALRLIAIEERERYRRALDDLGPDMAALAAELGPLALATVQPGHATGSVVRVHDGVDEAFVVSFIRDRDGVWRIAGL